MQHVRGYGAFIHYFDHFSNFISKDFSISIKQITIFIAINCIYEYFPF